MPRPDGATAMQTNRPTANSLSNATVFDAGRQAPDT